LLGPLAIGWAELTSRVPDGGGSRLVQRTLLLTSEDQRGQLLTAGISEQPDQPRRKVINDSHHASILPATVRSTCHFRRARAAASFITAGCTVR
jgi:hypothetical protein